MNKKMLFFLRMPEGEEKQAQERCPDIQILAMWAAVSRRRSCERRRAVGRICAHRQTYSQLAEKYGWLGQDWAAED